MRKKEGFTLIELLVVIAIIAILASIALLSLAPAQRSGRDARRIADLRQMQSVLQLYYNKCGFYPGPAAATSPCPAPDEGSVPNILPSTQVAWHKTAGNPDNNLEVVLGVSGFLDQTAAGSNGATAFYNMPRDPLAGRNAGNALNAYQYAVSSDRGSYVLRATLEADNQVLNSSIRGASVLGVDCSAARDYCVKF